MSIESEALLQEFRQAVYQKHSSPQTALDSSPDGAIRHRAEAYQAWLQHSQADGESSTIPDTLLRHWVVADITSWRSVDPNSAEKAVTAFHRNVFAYDTYAKLLKELDRQVYDQIISRSEAAETFNGFSSAGAPGDEPAKTDPSVILSELLKDITYRERADGSVLYLLKERPIFVDHGQQILMEAKAQDDELAILAALHMAKQKFGGSIELTGSDEFKRRALEVMIKHDVQVVLKSPAQEALRREMMGLPPVGDAAPGQDDAPAPDPTATQNQSSQPRTSDSAKPNSAVDATTAAAPASEPVNHYKGEVLEYGSAPYQFDISNSRSFYVTLKNSDGESRTTWGVDLERVIEEQGVGRGDQVELTNLGRKDVIIEVPIRDKAGQVLRYEERKTHRNEWGIEVTGKAPADVTPPAPLDPGESAIKAHDAKWLNDMGVPAEAFETHPKMLSMRGEDHALLLLNGVETTAEGFAIVERLMAQQTYRAAFAASLDSEFGSYNSHFQKQIADSEGYAIAKEMLADAESKYGPIPLAVIDSEAHIQDAMAKGDLDAVIEAIDAYDRQYLASLEEHRQGIEPNDELQADNGGFTDAAGPSEKPDAFNEVNASDAKYDHLYRIETSEPGSAEANEVFTVYFDDIELDSFGLYEEAEAFLEFERRAKPIVANDAPPFLDRLNFSHNGEPAEIDLTRFSQPPENAHNTAASADPSDRSGVPFSERELQYAKNLIPVEAHSWWEVQRVAIESWGRSLDEMEADLQVLGPEPELDQIIWFDKAGRQMPAPVDEAEWIAKQALTASKEDESNGFVSGDNTELRGRGAASLFPSADGVIELNPEEANMAQSDSNAEKEPKLILRGVTKLADDSFDTTVLLYQGKGDYLQGYVKVDGIKHQVLAFMNERHPDPQTGEIKPNFITLSEPSNSGTDDDSKWNQIGHGNAVNRRADGKEVHFDEVLFNVGGTIVKAKVTKHVDEPLHKKLGFLEPRKEREKPSASPKDEVPAVGPVSESAAPVASTKKRVRA
ncbi:putative DNA primase/helicase [Pseudomonas savastanoi pv. glycinea]|uniref:LPD7 domain-containing protein n=1 Tax=Pseudomonas savastanoi TaxID=29438 RepID=UPI000EFDCC35|nr:LPD7 domain-containing protein [Pseudomonas savastanoi]RMU43232.1 putative DNA primase/helicase [Pseudomonas savastanoi pv. glycinea]